MAKEGGGEKKSVGVDFEPGKPGKPNSGSTRRLMARCYHSAGEKRTIVSGSASFNSKNKMDAIGMRMDDAEGMVNVKREISFAGEINFEGEVSFGSRQDQLRVDHEGRVEQGSSPLDCGESSNDAGSLW